MRDNLDSRSELDNRPGLDSGRAGIGTGTITAIIAAVVVAGALFLFGPWANNTSTVTNSSPGTTTGQSSSIPRAATPVTPLSPIAPATTGTVR